jgi:biotin transport system substrate-specific component
MNILTLKNKSIEALSSFAESCLSRPNIIAILQIALASCLIGICAQIKIPLYFTPVPLTVQTSCVMLVGALLGSRKGALAVLCYLMQGWMGLPVWAGGAAGLPYFMGPTGGYLLALVAQAYLVGWFLERPSSQSLAKTIGIILLSICLQLGLGSLWLAQYVGIQQCFMLGFYPFIFVEIAKSVLVAVYVKSRKDRRFNT